MITLFFFKLLGGLLSVLGLSVLLHPKHYRTTLSKLDSQPTVVFLLGFILFLLGASIAILHTIWQGVAIVVTVLGYVILLEGSLFLIAPSMMISMVTKYVEHPVLLKVVAIFHLVFGIGLLYVGLGYHLVI